MTAVAGLLAVAIIAVVWLMLRHFAEAQAQWAVERRELLNRIQRPEFVPLSPAAQWVPPELEDDNINLVGTIAELPEDGA